MIVAVVALTLQQAAVTGTVVDAVTGAPVVGASAELHRHRVSTDATGRFAIAATRGDTLLVRRLGYRAAIVVVLEPAVSVALVPAPVPLGAVASTATAPAGRLTITRDVSDARAAGAVSTSDLVQQLPFVAARGSRGELALSLRASRAEQVRVTLDGMPLDDPATGIADIADIPLAAISSATAAPGSQSVETGSGASGGVVALTSADRPLLSAAAGAYGARSADGAMTAERGAMRFRGGASWTAVRNDFPFRNTRGTTGTDSVERRVNADVERASVFATVLAGRAQLLALAGRTDRGLVGPINVRSFDRDRGVSERALLRILAPAGVAMLDAGARVFDSRYHDPSQPGLDFAARSTALDAAAAGALGTFALRAGIGADVLHGSTIRSSSRTRGFASATRDWRLSRLRLSSGARVDAVHQSGMVPSLSLGADWGVRRVLYARVAQGFRVPSLYDLYFASPQRVLYRPLRPERVVLDAETGARAAIGPLGFAGALFERHTRDAIVWFPGNFSWSPSNVARERVIGAEGRAVVSLGEDGELQAWGGRYHSRLDVGVTPIPTPYVPYSAGGAMLAERVRALSITTTLRATDRRPFTSGPATRDRELPGTALVDLALAWHPRVAALVVVAVENVGDVRWQSVEGYPTAGRSWSASLTLQR